MWAYLRELVTAYDLSEAHSALVTEKHAAEVTRYGAGELHAVAALIAGVASQEAVKLIARQFIPLNNTFVYNGINGTAATMAL